MLNINDNEGKFHHTHTYRTIEQWLKNIISEVLFWDGVIAYAKEHGHRRLLARDFLESFKRENEFELTMPLRPEDVIVDIGCGGLPTYGNLINGKALKYFPLDPLAYEYHKLYDKYVLKPPVLPQFAIMEALSYYVRGEADYVICRNAMDHSMDAMSALLECLKVVRIGGKVVLIHIDSEGEFARYSGLHQWNITEVDNKLIFYNQKNNYVISDVLADYCNIELSRHPALDPAQHGRDWIVAQIEKKHDLPINTEQLHPYAASLYMGVINDLLMGILAKRNFFLDGSFLIPEGQKYILFGTGKNGENILSWFGQKRGQIAYCIDNSVKEGEETVWNGFVVKNPSGYKKSDGTIIISSDIFYNEMSCQLQKLGLKENKEYYSFFKLRQLLDKD